MKLGNLKNFIFFITFLLVNNLSVFAADKIESVPLINLEELSPTFEEDKDELEKLEKKNISLNNTEDSLENSNMEKDNNQVFLFNGWTFASSPTLQSIDHPIFDLWITSCENI